jgi:hypothetical protein
MKRKKSKRIIAFEKAGLIGCLNGTGINSKNYKKIIYKQEKKWIKDHTFFIICVLFVFM